MLHPPRQRSEEEEGEERGGGGEPRCCGVVEGQPRRVEGHPPIPLEHEDSLEPTHAGLRAATSSLALLEEIHRSASAEEQHQASPTTRRVPQEHSDLPASTAQHSLMTPQEQVLPSTSPDPPPPSPPRPVKQSSQETGELCVTGEQAAGGSFPRRRSDPTPGSSLGWEYDVTERGQQRNRGGSLPVCMTCEASRKLLSPVSWQLWCSVPGPSCCNKTYSEIFEVLKRHFHNESAFKKICVLNLIKHVLDVPLSGEVAEVPVQRFLDAEKFFGPLQSSEHGCVFLKNVEIVAKRSRTGTRKARSWFAGRMDRETAERHLQNQEKGTFLVRMCSTAAASEGSFAISVVAENREKERCVEHFLVEGNPDRVKRDPRSLHLRFEEQEFPSLPDVIDHIFQVDRSGRIWHAVEEVTNGIPPIFKRRLYSAVVTKDDLCRFLPSLALSTEVVVLKLRALRLQDADVFALCDVLAENAFLRKVVLLDLEISGRAMASLISALQKKASIHSLWIGQRRRLSSQEEEMIAAPILQSWSICRCWIPVFDFEVRMRLWKKVTANEERSRQTFLEKIGAV